MMNNGKEEQTRRATWMLKYKKGSLDTKFRDNKKKKKKKKNIYLNPITQYAYNFKTN